jgi:hypothetical protein
MISTIIGFLAGLALILPGTLIAAEAINLPHPAEAQLYSIFFHEDKIVLWPMPQGQPVWQAFIIDGDKITKFDPKGRPETDLFQAGTNIMSHGFDESSNRLLENFVLEDRDFTPIGSSKAKGLVNAEMFWGRDHTMILTTGDQDDQKCVIWDRLKQKTTTCTTPSIPVGRFYDSAWLGDVLYVVRKIYGEDTPDLHKYNIASDKWSILPIPFESTRRQSCRVFAIENRIYLYGGREGRISFNPFNWISPHESGYNDYYVSDGLVFNPITNKFSPMAKNNFSGKRARYGVQQIVEVVDGALIHVDDNDEAQLYSAKKDQWMVLPDFKLPFELDEIRCELSGTRLVCLGEKRLWDIKLKLPL